MALRPVASSQRLPHAIQAGRAASGSLHLGRQARGVGDAQFAGLVVFDLEDKVDRLVMA